VLSGALQDYKRAVLVGTQTFGKGVVQRLFPLDGNYGLKLTVQRWYTPSGRSIHKGSDGRGGLTPDLVVNATAGMVGEQTLATQLHPRSVLFRSLLNGYAAEFRGNVGPQFTVTPTIRQGFISRLERNGIRLDSNTVAQNAPYFDRMLGMQITRLAVSDSAARRNYLQADPQLAEAVALLQHASTQQDVWTALVTRGKLFETLTSDGRTRWSALCVHDPDKRGARHGHIYSRRYVTRLDDTPAGMVGRCFL
jgi:carboxyl-terminal processing protease